MKTILIFIGLKVLEISAIIFIPYGIGLTEKNLTGLFKPDNNIFWLWANGFFCIGMLFIAFLFMAALFLTIHKNWEIAKRISGKN